MIDPVNFGWNKEAYITEPAIKRYLNVYI